MKVCIISGGTLNYINYMIKLYESLRIYHKKVYFQFNIIYDNTCECKEYKRFIKIIQNYTKLYNDDKIIQNYTKLYKIIQIIYLYYI